jgi:hypothetical protein
MLIPSAQESRQITENHDIRRQEIEQALSYQIDRIARARAQGLSYASFNVPSKYEYEIREMFLKKGYSFRPTGYSGGVWQLTENICW